MNAIETPFGIIALHLQHKAFHVLGRTASPFSFFDFVKEIDRRVDNREVDKTVEEFTLPLIFEMALAHFRNNAYSKTCHIYLSDNCVFTLKQQFKQAPQINNFIYQIVAFQTPVDYWDVCLEFRKHPYKSIRKERAEY